MFIYMPYIYITDCPGDHKEFNVGYGGCDSYAQGTPNAKFCVDDGGCILCGCSCAHACGKNNK